MRMEKNKMIFIVGGARSGKSTLAEKLAKELGETCLYIATSQVLDEEMAFRVKSHRERRPAYWDTIEAPLNAHEVIREKRDEYDVILLDCLTVFLSNLLLLYPQEGEMIEKEKEILTIVEELLTEGKNGKASLIIVSNEVGEGIVPVQRLGRDFRDISGRANQMVARWADEAYFMFSGIPVELKAINRLNQRVSTRMIP